MSYFTVVEAAASRTSAHSQSHAATDGKKIEKMRNVKIYIHLSDFCRLRNKCYLCRIHFPMQYYKNNFKNKISKDKSSKLRNAPLTLPFHPRRTPLKTP